VKRTGQSILEEAVFAGVPLGADPSQMRADQDQPPPAGEEDELDEKKKCKKKKDDEEDEGGEEESLWVPPQKLVSFQTFYQEGNHEEAAKVMAELFGLDDEPFEEDEEKVKADWARFISEQESKFNFLRKGMIKFNTFLGTAKSSWDKLSDAQKESATKFLKSKASKMSAELKSLLSGLDAKSPSDKVLMAAMLAYMFGVGMSGEGAVAGESDGE